MKSMLLIVGLIGFYSVGAVGEDLLCKDVCQEGDLHVYEYKEWHCGLGGCLEFGCKLKEVQYNSCQSEYLQGEASRQSEKVQMTRARCYPKGADGLFCTKTPSGGCQCHVFGRK